MHGRSRQQAMMRHRGPNQSMSDGHTVSQSQTVSDSQTAVAESQTVADGDAMAQADTVANGDAVAQAQAAQTAVAECDGGRRMRVPEPNASVPDGQRSGNASVPDHRMTVTGIVDAGLGDTHRRVIGVVRLRVLGNGVEAERSLE